MRRRAVINFSLEVDLDPRPGVFYHAIDWVQLVQTSLEKMAGKYNPIVTVHDMHSDREDGREWVVKHIRDPKLLWSREKQEWVEINSDWDKRNITVYSHRDAIHSRLPKDGRWSLLLE